jgi:epoxyqueuosine reductase
MSLTGEIKDHALDLGYSLVGITTADDFTEHIQEVQSRGADYDFFVGDPRQFLKGSRPRAAMPAARSIIVLAWDYAQKAFPGSLVDKIGRIYLSRCYNAPPDRINGDRLRLMVDFLKAKGCAVGSGFMVPERRAAARAGVAHFGRNNFAYVRGIGSFVMLTALVVDRELECDAPTEELSCPKDCTRCMDACPTRAIYAPNKLDPRRCLGFNHWWTQEGRPGVSSSIPPGIRIATGTRVHGCDLCQEACPRNAAKLQAGLPPDPFLEALAGRFSLPALLELSDAFYARSVQPVM